jgi:hypothetical protein
MSVVPVKAPSDNYRVVLVVAFDYETGPHLEVGPRSYAVLVSSSTAT